MGKGRMDKPITTLRGMRVAVLSVASSAGEQGGAERFYRGLIEGLREIGCETDEIAIQAEESSFQAIMSNYMRFEMLDLSEYDLVISSKVPTYAVRHPNHIVYLMHTVRVFDDMFEKAFPRPELGHFVQRAELHHRDFDALNAVKRRFAIGHEVARRLYRWRGLECEVLHPPLGWNHFKEGNFGDYFFLPGRLHPWKRVDLLIAAIKQSKMPLKLVIAGTGEDELHLKALAADDERIEFRGHIDDDTLVQLYAECLAVPFVPVREDYGYVTLEAFASGKPVLTCNDAGEPCFFVRPFDTGLIVEPTPEEVCKGLEWLWKNRALASAMGARGKEFIQDMSWSQTARTLVTSVLQSTAAVQSPKTKITVLDMQPITPAVGGGRLRLLGLYHNLGAYSDCVYVGSYDWVGEPEKSLRLSDTLLETVVPLSDLHHAAATDLAQQAGGKIVIDLAFSQLAHLSKDYIAAANTRIATSEVVIFSHPWVYPAVKDRLRVNQLIIYDSQNVEGFLRAQLLDEHNPVEEKLLRQVVQDENDIGWRADWILACSHEDLLRFNRLYGFPLEKMRVVPNGVMAFRDPLPTDESKSLARREWKIHPDAFVAIFIGSAYGPNVQAANFIVQQLAPRLPNVLFVIAGGVGDAVNSTASNVRITGSLDEKDKVRWLHLADIAVNPMQSGSGTNIKMFDFMAMRLPVVTTAIGARGIEYAGAPPFLTTDGSALAFAETIEKLRADTLLRHRLGQSARKCVEDGYAWERISAQLGCFIEARKRLIGQPKPLFSVVVPTYERHDQLDQLIECLRRQIERDFEVVIVDQSAVRWRGADGLHGFALTYFHSPVKGAVRARNVGAMLAQGSILAFVDDDCQPENYWLINARRYFHDKKVVGIEGLIYSDHLDDPGWRPVANVGFEGLGFMTANLFVRSNIFQFLGGFDIRFDQPHFREDTDFGWRMSDLGRVPYAEDVKVFHPAQPKNKERESDAVRVQFFQKDALLYIKHPDRYRELYMAERHFAVTDGFVENLLKGFSDLGVNVPKWIMATFDK